MDEKNEKINKSEVVFKKNLKEMREVVSFAQEASRRVGSLDTQVGKVAFRANKVLGRIYLLPMTVERIQILQELDEAITKAQNDTVETILKEGDVDLIEIC